MTGRHLILPPAEAREQARLWNPRVFLLLDFHLQPLVHVRGENKGGRAFHGLEHKYIHFILRKYKKKPCTIYVQTFCTRQFIYQQIIFDRQEDRLSSTSAAAHPSHPVYTGPLRQSPAGRDGNAPTDPICDKSNVLNSS